MSHTQSITAKFLDKERRLQNNLPSDSKFVQERHNHKAEEHYTQSSEQEPQVLLTKIRDTEE